MGDFPDIAQANFDPTRGPACLDIALTNFSDISSSVWPPLETRDGTASDHQCVIFKAREEHARKFTRLKKTTRKHTDRAAALFGQELEETNWDAVLGPARDDPHTLIDRYNAYVAKLTDRHLPLRTVKYRSNEHPWITEGIRRLYRRDGKTAFWMRLRDEQFAKVQNSKLKFIDTMVGKSVKGFFSAVKSLSCKAKPQ